MRYRNERGIALITTLLVMMLVSALLVGFTSVIVSDQRYRFIDRDRSRAFYAASGALEKLTADLGNLFYKNVAPTNAQVAALTSSANTPTIPGVTFAASSTPIALAASELSEAYCPGVAAQRIVGTNGYTIRFCGDGAGNPTSIAGSTMIQSGPYADLFALKTPYQLDVTARTTTGGEVHLVRTIESVAIPVFQFGIFSDVDLAFNAADDFSFGGRVHTNGNLFLAQSSSSTLTINAKVTAVGDVVRQRLSNGVSIDTSGHTGTVAIAKDSSSTVNMLRTWGSVIDGPGSAANPLWEGISKTTYKGYIKNRTTGARQLNLPLITVGGTTPDLTRRPAVGEDPGGLLFNDRLFSKASLRILLSDTAADITNLPTVTSSAPLSLEANWAVNKPAGLAPISAENPPIALSPGGTGVPWVSTSGGGGNIRINFVDAATAAAFKPTFRLQGYPNVITCLEKKNNSLEGCTNLPAGATANLPVTAVWPGGAASAPVVSASSDAGSGKIAFSGAGIKDLFGTTTFYDANGVAITCEEFDATSYGRCSTAPTGTPKILTASLTAKSAAGVSLLGGFLKIERQAPNGTWTDVTIEIVNYGIGGRNLDGDDCGDPSPRAIIRLQRFRDNAGGACNYNTDATGAISPTNWWPNVLYDAREAVLRDSGYPGTNVLTFNGVMHYVALDVGNLAKWFRGTAPYNTGTGTNSVTDNGGFTVYFSDRRNNRNESNQETGEYGWEDHVNPGATNGAPNGVLDAGENVNGSIVSGVPTQQRYGGRPNYQGVYMALPPGSSAPFVSTATPVSTLTDQIARANRPIFFRRALKLINGRDIRATGVTGLTFVAENPVYIQGDWNANPGGSGGFSQAHASTAIIADAVTLLSQNWNDVTSLKFPYAPEQRKRATNTWYRFATIAGKSLIFPRPSGTDSTFGTDGGAHAFLHYLEGRPTSSDTINYRGSLATFYYSRQATGTFKGNQSTVYEVPANRAFAFDIDFSNASLLPPNTPVFRDMNAVGFSQELRPGR